jgi:hypothetical protein
MAENSGLKFIKYNLQKLKLFLFSKDILSFLLFLALAACFWFVNALGKDRETNITIPIRYIGIPQNIAIINSAPENIVLSVKDQGINLFSYYNSHLTPLTIDVSRIFYQKGEILITPDQLRGKISKYLQPSTSVLEIHPDSIMIQYEKLSQKDIPIEFVSSIEFAQQYILSDKIQLSPSYVTVFGNKKNIDKLKTVRTEIVKLKNLNDTNIFTCKIKPIKFIKFSSPETKVSIYVEQFTEKKVIIPITSINCPSNLFVRTFPAFVNATYNVGLSHFNNNSINDLQIYLDYNDLKLAKQSKQKLIIKNNTSHISNIRILPQEVEFILEER